MICAAILSFLEFLTYQNCHNFQCTGIHHVVKLSHVSQFQYIGILSYCNTDISEFLLNGISMYWNFLPWNYWNPNISGFLITGILKNQNCDVLRFPAYQNSNIRITYILVFPVYQNIDISEFLTYCNSKLLEFGSISVIIYLNYRHIRISKISEFQ